MNIAFNTAVAGMQAAQSRLDTAAQAAAREPGSTENIVQASVEMVRAETQFAASAAIARTSAEMTQTLLDITV